MLKASRRVLSLLCAVLAVGGLAAASAQAVMLNVNGERTAISANVRTGEFLSTFGVTVTTTGPASTGSDGSLILPITGGSVFTGSLDATIFHSGGVTFSAGDRSLNWRDFVLVHEAGRTWLKALLNDRGFVIFAWVNHVNVNVSSSGNEATVTGELFLSEAAADAFDFLIGSSVAVPGTEIAKMKSTIRFGT